MKVVECEQARRLRSEQGLPIRAIAASLRVSVSSVSRWVRDVELTTEQEAALRDANPRFNQRRSGTARSQANARARRIAAQAHGRSLAAEGDPSHRMGCMLYWAEGGKSRNQVRFTNADPTMVVLFLGFLRRFFPMTDEKVRLTINVHLGNGATLQEIESWWLARLELARERLLPSVVNKPSRASLRKRRTLVYGTARLDMCSTFAVQSIYGAIQAYAGIERPEWLDC